MWQKLSKKVYQALLPHPLSPLLFHDLRFSELWLCPNRVPSLIREIIKWWEAWEYQIKGVYCFIEYFSLTHFLMMGRSWPLLIGQIIFRQSNVWTYSGIRAYKAQSISTRILINLDLRPRRKSTTRILSNTKLSWSANAVSKLPIMLFLSFMSHLMLCCGDCPGPGQWQHQ